MLAFKVRLIRRGWNSKEVASERGGGGKEKSFFGEAILPFFPTNKNMLIYWVSRADSDWISGKEGKKFHEMIE